MKYKAGQRRRAHEYEPDLVQWWKKHRIFERSVEERPEDDSYVFYDGPPFITGMPHHGTLLSSIVKDAVPRYWTMRGKRVERRWGWDCHGLPAENFVEKQLGITDRREIGTKWSLEDYIIKARESMVANSETWEGTIDRIGRWVDFKGAYRTMDKDFMESVWWAFKTLYEAGKIYEGRKVLMYDTKFCTPVSKSEVTMDNDAYQTVTDPSAYVKFNIGTVADLLSSDSVSLSSSKESDPAQPKNNPQTAKSVSVTNHEKLKDLLKSWCKNKPDLHLEDKNIYLLAWTTTPWTLPANMALAVNPELEYCVVKVWASDGEEAKTSQPEILILAKSRLEAVLKDVDYEIIQGGIKGSELIGLTYTPICDILEGEASSRATSLSRSSSTQSQDLKSSSFRASDSSRISSEITTPPMKSKLKDTWTVLGGDFVSDADGTGIVHIAPAYGEDDYKLSLEHEVDFVDVLDEYGYYLPEVAKCLHELGVRDTDDQGIEIWAGNKFIAKCLEEKGIVWKIEYIKHEYPFNPRSKQRIIYRAFPSWFFDIQGSKPLMLAQNENINWFPAYLKHGRFAKNIEQAPDWNLSRDRFWATAMPVWKGDKGAIKVVGSYDELKQYSGIELEDYHRPWVDEITFDALVDDVTGEVSPIVQPVDLSSSKDSDPVQPKNASQSTKTSSSQHIEHFTRIDKVLDCWFESGSMPFAQLHYPFENKEKFERNYPADFIVEYVGQVRAWFYYVHCVNSTLASIGAFGTGSSSLRATSSNSPELALRTSKYDSLRASNFPRTSSEITEPSNSKQRSGNKQLNAFKNVITTGTLAGNDGRKMSKSLGNYTDPNELMNQYSADALRFLLLSSPVLSGEDFALTDKDVSDVARKLAMIWNVYDFFVTYASVDNWDNENSWQPKDKSVKDLENPLDRWIMSRLHQLKGEIIAGMDEYNIPRALSGVLPFVDDLSNWFVRRSRRRFWKSEDDGDKAEAYWTLYTVLTKLAQILAPFVPFLAEELYQNMTGGKEFDSVHLANYPMNVEVDEQVLADMARVRAVINEGLALRMQKSDQEEQIKVRQPLAKLVYAGEKLPDWGEEIVREEVNVKVVEPGEETWIDKNITPELAEEGFVRELIRAVQSARKKAGLQVDDRIKLNVSVEIPAEWVDTLKAETLATELTQDGNYAYDEIIKVNGENITISLEKI